MLYTLVFILCTPITDGPQSCTEIWREPGFQSSLACRQYGHIKRAEYRQTQPTAENLVPRATCVWDPDAITTQVSR